MRDKTKNESFVDRLKIVLRPLIFPMDDLLAQVKKEDTVFDIGCGSGQFLLLVAEFVKAKSLFGIEIHDRLVNNAKNLFDKFQKDADATFEKYDGTQIPEQIKNFDKVFLNDVLHHIPKKQQSTFIGNLHKAMGSGSKFVLKDMNAATPLVFFNKMHDLVFSREIGNEISVKKAAQLLEENGFVIESQMKKRIFWYAHYIIVCKKV